MTTPPHAPSASPPTRGPVRDLHAGAWALVAAAHAGPTVAVTAIATLLAVAADVRPAAVVVVGAAVLAGQLTIGWGNDLLDVERDRAVGRLDKPLASGQVSVRAARVALALAAVSCAGLSWAAGPRAAAVHLGLVVAMGHAYNLGLKATVWSWVPYAVAFGSLPVVAGLAAPDPSSGPWWTAAAGAMLGVGAHLLNALPDLADDVRTGVRGLPHTLGPGRSRLLAAALLGAASLAAGLGPPGAPSVPVLLGLLLAAGLVVVTATRQGRVPFRAAMLLALLDVVLLVAAR